MRSLFLALAAVSLAGCSFTLSAPTSPSTVAPATTTDRVVLEGTRALVIAHNAYQGSTAIIAPMVRAGVFNNAQLDRIQSLNDQAKALLDGADKTQSVAARASGVFAIVEELTRLAGR